MGEWPRHEERPGAERGGAQPYWVAIDGGGTGTRARLVAAPGGAVLGVGRAGPSALGQGATQAWQSVTQAIAAAFAQARLANTNPANANLANTNLANTNLANTNLAEIALGLGLSGAEVAPWRDAFLAGNPGYGRCELASDATTLLLGAHGGQAGVIVIGGTGSVAQQRTHAGAVNKVGGWGFGLGDEGSGAWLGRRAVQHLSRVLDGRAAADGLSARLAPVVGGHRDALIEWCRPAGPAGHGSLAPQVFAAAAEGVRSAEALLQQASQELAMLVAALDVHEPGLPVVVSGSVAERLWERWPEALRARVVPRRGDALDGALQLLKRAVGSHAAARGMAKEGA